MTNLTYQDIIASTKQIKGLVSKTNSLILCDASCQRQKELVKLKTEMDNAEINLEDAPSNLENAKRNYYTFLNGNYNQQLYNQNILQADKIYNSSLRKHNKLMNEVRTYNNYYTSQTTSLKKINNYSEKIKKENKEIKNEYDELIDSIQTNNRKSTYKIKNISFINKIQNFIIILYITLILIYSLIIVKNFNNFNNIEDPSKKYKYIGLHGALVIFMLYIIYNLLFFPLIIKSIYDFILFIIKSIIL
jgi:hypothetical protein